jgi:predicted regulator of Ras-like GTPase activity (Roadblock/LC7/MglB family)
MLKKVLQRFFSLVGVTTVMVIDSEGRVIEEVGSDAMGSGKGQLAAVVSFLMAESGVMAIHLGQKSLSMVFVEFYDRCIISVPLKEDYFLVFLTRPDANVGKIQYELKKNQAQLLSLL